MLFVHLTPFVCDTDEEIEIQGSNSRGVIN